MQVFKKRVLELFLTWLDDRVDLLHPLGHFFAGGANEIQLGVLVFRVVSLCATEMHTVGDLVVEVLSHSMLYIAQAIS